MIATLHVRQSRRGCVRSNRGMARDGLGTVAATVDVGARREFCTTILAVKNP